MLLLQIQILSNVFLSNLLKGFPTNPTSKKTNCWFLKYCDLKIGYASMNVTNQLHGCTIEIQSKNWHNNNVNYWVLKSQIYFHFQVATTADKIRAIQRCL